MLNKVQGGFRATMCLEFKYTMNVYIVSKINNFFQQYNELICDKRNNRVLDMGLQDPDHTPLLGPLWGKIFV